MPDIIYEITVTFFVAVFSFFIWKFGINITLNKLFLLLLGVVLIFIAINCF